MGGLAAAYHPLIDAHGSADTQRILVVDDDPPVRRMLQRTLSAEGYDVTAVGDGGGALVAAQRSAPDLVVLDVRLPGLDGLSVCRRLRSGGMGAPILLLTARDSIRDRVAGLDAGADDYLVKPFAPDELRARLRALLRRGQPAGELLAYADLVLDRRRRVVRRGDWEIELTGREAALLELLISSPRSVITRELALERVWEGGAVPNIVDRYVGALRRKLGPPPLIRTVRGVGFMLRR